jgi:hypothetical protein
MKETVAKILSAEITTVLIYWGLGFNRKIVPANSKARVHCLTVTTLVMWKSVEGISFQKPGDRAVLVR